MKGAVSPDTQKNFTTANGLQTYNLEAPAKLMFPQLTPILNNTTRISGKGKQAEYKAITGINTAALNGWTAEGNSGAKVTTNFNDVIAVYKIFSLADGVTFEAEWEGQGFQDVKALAVANLIRAMKIQEENNLLFGQNSVSASNQQAPGAAGSVAAPNVTQASSGGSIASGTYYVGVVPWTGMGAGVLSAVSTVTVASGSTNQFTVTPPNVSGQPILGFDVYISSTSASSGFYKVTSSQLPAGAVLGGTILGNQVLTNGAPVTVNSIPTTGAQPPVSDGTASSLAYNGYLAQTFGGSGAYTKSLRGALSINALNDLFLGLWNSAKGDPDVIYANAQESIKITNLTLGAGGTPYFITVDNQNGATAGYRVARLTNQVTGTEVPVNVHPTLPQGTMLAMQRKPPGWYVPTDIPNVMAIDVVQDYTEIDYPPVYDPTGGNGDTWNIAVKCLATFKLYMPLLQGVITGITAS
jgi:hypothetical protein